MKSEATLTSPQSVLNGADLGVHRGRLQALLQSHYNLLTQLSINRKMHKLIETSTSISFNTKWYESIEKRLLGTQNPAGLKPRVGLTPTSGTKDFVNY
jgi:hypothetical protein